MCNKTTNKTVINMCNKNNNNSSVDTRKVKYETRHLDLLEEDIYKCL